MDKKTAERIMKKYEWYEKKLDKLTKEVIEKSMIQLKKRFNKLKKNVIKDWYLDYGHNLKITPGDYHRKLDLFKIPKIYINKKTGEFICEYNPDFMTKWHRVSNEYIYENSFVKGWHGGADKLNPWDHGAYNEPHPDEGTPYWRKPRPKDESFIYGVHYIHWYDVPAARSASPEEQIIEGFKIEIENVQKEMQKKYDDGIEKYSDELIKYIEKYGR